MYPKSFIFKWLVVVAVSLSVIGAGAATAHAR